MSDLWSCQYMLLDYVDDDAFSGVIKEIDMAELFLVVNSLPNNKAVRLSEISNKFWKHCGEKILACFLKLLNLCLSLGIVLAAWKRA
ncbi:hypothetical protein G9A89_019735 [Geosiphon pyriformis]|nr:hypothetical protein G9A89_019735 [Geosiphon pyriformis]